MRTWIKQLFCRHKWRREGNTLVAKNPHYIVKMSKYKCMKCGKVRYKE